METALGGKKALEILSQHRFDVIVWDWKIPGLNGVRLFEHLAATDPAATRRVLLMTGDGSAEEFRNSCARMSSPVLRNLLRLGNFAPQWQRFSGRPDPRRMQAGLRGAVTLTFPAEIRRR